MESFKYLQSQFLALERIATHSKRHVRQDSFLVDLPAHSQLTPEFTKITAFRNSAARMAFFIFLSFLSLGVLPMVCIWFPSIRVYIARKSVSAFRDSDCVLVCGQDAEYLEIKIIKHEKVRFFVYRKLRYIYDEDCSSFRVS